MRHKLGILILVAIFTSSVFTSCEEDEERKGRQLIDMMEDALGFVISDVDEVEEGEVWELTLAVRGVQSGRCELRLRYYEDYGWALYGLDELVDELPGWVNPDELSYDVAESYDLEYDADLGPIAPVSTHMDSSELRRAVLGMAGACATLDALAWSEED